MVAKIVRLVMEFYKERKKHNDKLLFIAGILETQRKRSGPSRSNGKIVDNAIGFQSTYPLDSDPCGG